MTMSPELRQAVLSFYNPSFEAIQNFCEENDIEMEVFRTPQWNCVSGVGKVAGENLLMINGRFYFLSELNPGHKNSETWNLVFAINVYSCEMGEKILLGYEEAKKVYEQSEHVRNILYPIYEPETHFGVTSLLEQGGEVIHRTNDDKSFMGILDGTKVIYNSGRFVIAQAFDYEWNCRIMTLLKAQNPKAMN